jgi:hypothetical protein
MKEKIYMKKTYDYYLSIKKRKEKKTYDYRYYKKKMVVKSKFSSIFSISLVHCTTVDVIPFFFFLKK